MDWLSNLIFYLHVWFAVLLMLVVSGLSLLSSMQNPAQTCILWCRFVVVYVMVQDFAGNFLCLKRSCSLLFLSALPYLLSCILLCLFNWVMFCHHSTNGVYSARKHMADKRLVGVTRSQRYWRWTIKINTLVTWLLQQNAKFCMTMSWKLSNFPKNVAECNLKGNQMITANVPSRHITILHILLDNIKSKRSRNNFVWYWYIYNRYKLFSKTSVSGCKHEGAAGYDVWCGLC